MNQKDQLQIGVAQYENAATVLSTSVINTTHQHFQMRYITFIYLKGFKSYQPSNFKYRTRAIKGRAFNSKIIFWPLGAPFTQESLQFEKYFLSRGSEFLGTRDHFQMI